MEIKTTIIDDLMPQEFADKLEKFTTSTAFPWYYREDLAAPPEVRNKLENYKNTPGFAHSSLFFGQKKEKSFHRFQKMPYVAFPKIGYKGRIEILSCRLFLTLPVEKIAKHSHIHVDSDQSHAVLLYYVNDSDGDTFFYGKDKNGELVQTISPKKNRGVIFDGSIYHAASLPSKNKRIVVNFNVLLDFHDLHKKEGN
jgi:hypothetical protein